MKPEIKKLLILNLPYLLFVYLFDKVGAAVRLSPGMDASQKILHLISVWSTWIMYPSMAILRRYAAMLLVGTSFIFSSISFRSSSVT